MFQWGWSPSGCLWVDLRPFIKKHSEVNKDFHFHLQSECNRHSKILGRHAVAPKNAVIVLYGLIFRKRDIFLSQSSLPLPSHLHLRYRKKAKSRKIEWSTGLKTCIVQYTIIEYWGLFKKKLMTAQNITI